MKVAFATDNGKELISRHFGDAEFYDIYEIGKNKSDYLKRMVNTTEEEDEKIHADPKKAKGVAGLFKGVDVKALVSKEFGPNIKRMKKKFVCVLMNNESIEAGVKKLQESIDIIKDEWHKGENRNHLNFKNI
jgi:predicted Fe-Mo cluster-binding NifX family protein